MAYQDYFTHFELSQLVDRAKMGDPREKTSLPPTSRTWLVSHVTLAKLKPTEVRWRAISSAKDLQS